MQKMNEYALQKEKMRHESMQQQQQHQHQRGGLTKGHTGKGHQPYSKEFAKVNYRDQDMKRIATTGKGTTSAYNYQDSDMPDMRRQVDRTK